MYITIEIIYRLIMQRTPTHWTMFVLGGLAFVIIGSINEVIEWDLLFWWQVAIGTSVSVALEFVFGCVLNIWMQLNIWDYSDMPLNILGQVCVPFAVIWAALVAFAIVLDDYLRYWMFDEEKPHYRF